jgi:hypothetical protein
VQRPRDPDPTTPQPGRTPYAFPAAGAGATAPRPGGPERAANPPRAAGRVRPNWANALVVLLGAWLVAAPFVLGYDRAGAEFSATVNDIATGVVLVLVALLGMVVPARGTALWVVEAALGAWVVAAPFVLFYSADSPATAATWNDILTGTAVVLVAAAAAVLARRRRRGRDRPRDG